MLASHHELCVIYEVEREYERAERCVDEGHDAVARDEDADYTWNGNDGWVSFCNRCLFIK